MTTKAKTRKAVAKVIGAVPHQGYDRVLWKVRLMAPWFPFHIDSDMSYESKEDADKEAEKWSKKKIVVQIGK